MTGQADDNARYMARALELARNQLGRVAPNPAVGCVIVRNGAIIAEAATGDGGRPHGEEIALALAGDAARGATVYVSLEPCARRTSDTPSCSQRLIAAEPAHVVIACREPNPHSANGMDALQAAGLHVELGVLEAEALYLNRGFFHHIATGRPWVTIDPQPASHDADLTLLDDETPEAALDRLGAAGLTRVRISPGNFALVARLDRAGLINERAG
jgi:diaminohydroxyphosphoribosylaminopyrimidine deaminase/5-amino-6-(5-phosphoribosylamino)uracil reductase